MTILLFGLGLFAWAALSQQPITLAVLMTTPDAQPWKQGLIADFEKTHAHIRLKLVEGPNAVNLVEDLYTSSFLLGDSPYDLLNMDVVWTSKFAAAGWLRDLSDRLTTAEIAAFSPKDIDAGRFEGRLYRIPIPLRSGAYSTTVPICLPPLDSSPRKHFAESIAIARMLKQAGKIDWGYVWQGRQYEGLVAMFVEVLQGFGGYWVKSDSLEVGLDRPEPLQAIAFLRDTLRLGISPPGSTTYQEEEARRLFQSGRVAMMRSWPYAWPLANKSDSPIQGKIGIKTTLGQTDEIGRRRLFGRLGFGHCQIFPTSPRSPGR